MLGISARFILQIAALSLSNILAYAFQIPALHFAPIQATQLSSSLGEAFGIEYEAPLFRPPAEWRSLIIQVTIGCSWNRCSFCEMYQDKNFRARPMDDIIDELDKVVAAGGARHVRDVFLADGDAMTLPTSFLEYILDAIHERFPRVRRVSSYCLPRNIRGKTVDSLSKLKSKGLSLVYVGCESGSDSVLSAVQKGETFESSLEALNKLKDAKIKRSVMILIGLGGKEYSDEHATRSAALCSETKPEFLSLLTVSFPRGKGRVEEGYKNIQGNGEGINPTFQELSTEESLGEMKTFLDALTIPKESRTIFRSDHASNYLVLKGILGRDKQRLLVELKDVLDGDESKLRPEWLRGL